jgi:hypothetical protein
MPPIAGPVRYSGFHAAETTGRTVRIVALVPGVADQDELATDVAGWKFGGAAAAIVERFSGGRGEPAARVPAAEYTCWGDFWKRTVMWNDEPTEDSCADYQRGRGYAREAVAAIVKDAALSRSLRIVVETILERAFRRRGPRGGLCRQISSAEDGFLTELVDIAVAGARHLGSVPSTDFR